MRSFFFALAIAGDGYTTAGRNGSPLSSPESSAWRRASNSVVGAGSSSTAKLSRKVKYSELKNMLTSTSTVGNMATAANSGLPSKVAKSVTARPTTSKSATHTRPKTAKAPKFFQQAQKLKNMLFTGDTSCQCTSAGACQNISDSGR